MISNSKPDLSKFMPAADGDLTSVLPIPVTEPVTSPPPEPTGTLTFDETDLQGWTREDLRAYVDFIHGGSQ